MAGLGSSPPWSICEILGIPVADRQKLKSWAKAFVLMFASPIEALDVNGRTAEEGVRGFLDYFTAMVRERQMSPGDDLMSHLGRAVRDGVMTEDECVAQCVLLLTAGSNTVGEQIINGVHDLLTHPDALATLKEKPELIPTAVEEMLRHETPIPFLNRIATEDLEIGGTLIKKGQVVFLGFGAGNRDPEIFTDPDRGARAEQRQPHVPRLQVAARGRSLERKRSRGWREVGARGLGTSGVFHAVRDCRRTGFSRKAVLLRHSEQHGPFRE